MTFWQWILGVSIPFVAMAVFGIVKLFFAELRFYRKAKLKELLAEIDKEKPPRKRSG